MCVYLHLETFEFYLMFFFSSMLKEIWLEAEGMRQGLLTLCNCYS